MCPLRICPQIKPLKLRQIHDIYVYTTMCETDNQWEAAVKHRKLSSVLRDDLEGWDGVSGREA